MFNLQCKICLFYYFNNILVRLFAVRMAELHMRCWRCFSHEIVSKPFPPLPLDNLENPHGTPRNVGWGGGGGGGRGVSQKRGHFFLHHATGAYFPF